MNSSLSGSQSAQAAFAQKISGKISRMNTSYINIPQVDCRQTEVSSEVACLASIDRRLKITTKRHGPNNHRRSRSN
jgi:hypothetical protein